MSRANASSPICDQADTIVQMKAPPRIQRRYVYCGTGSTTQRLGCSHASNNCWRNLVAADAASFLEEGGARSAIGRLTADAPRRSRSVRSAGDAGLDRTCSVSASCDVLSGIRHAMAEVREYARVTSAVDA